MAYPFLQDVVFGFFGIKIFLPIPTFGAIVVSAMSVSFWLFREELKRIPSEAPLIPMLSNFVLVTVVAGTFGARLFHILEYPEDFIRDPMAMIFSRGGFTILGGYLFGGIAGVLFIKWYKLPILPALDAGAPSMILSYAIGRLGCQFSGDGDWGIVSNLALKPHWVPTWFWAQQYQNNIARIFIPYPGVYPTPIYESLVSFAIFLILWKLRKHPFGTGWLFSLYMVLSGLERFFIEKIRVNSKYEINGFEFTQAEMLSSILIVLGIAGLVYFSRFRSSSGFTELRN